MPYQPNFCVTFERNQQAVLRLPNAAMTVHPCPLMVGFWRAPILLEPDEWTLALQRVLDWADKLVNRPIRGASCKVADDQRGDS